MWLVLTNQSAFGLPPDLVIKTIDCQQNDNERRVQVQVIHDRAVVVVKWSAYSPSTPSIRVWI